jgi:Protein of unknown function (DUF2281)
MNAQTLESLEIPEEIVNNLKKFSPERRKQVFDFVRFLAQQQEAEVVQQQGSPKQRIPDLDRGAVLSISEDFDAPLPDDFWCGVDDPVTMTPAQIQRLNASSLGI